MRRPRTRCCSRPWTSRCGPWATYNTPPNLTSTLIPTHTPTPHQVKEYQLQISRDSSTTLPTLIELLHSSSAAVQLAGSDVIASQYSCSARGVCALGQCLCDEGYAGLRCEIRCEAGWGGFICTEPACPCGPRGSCTVPGVCECAAGWAGPFSERYL